MIVLKKIDNITLFFYFKMEVTIKTLVPNTQNTAPTDKSGVRVNEQITSPQVRLILQNGENIGIISTREALKKAVDMGLDLVEIASAGQFPVCKILDAGKYKYELQKRKADSRKKQKVIEIKEVKFTPNIGDNDYSVKMRSARRFLEEGNKVKFTLRFRGREMSYVDLGTAVLNRARTDLEDIARVEVEPKLEGRQMSLIMSKKV